MNNSLSLPTKAYIAVTVSAGMACLTVGTFRAESADLPRFLGFLSVALLGIISCVFFLLNTIQVAIVITLSEKRRLWTVWRDCYFWSFPYYVLGAAVAGALAFTYQLGGLTIYLLVLPMIYITFRSYR